MAKYTIEINDGHNSTIYFPLLKRHLRGRFDIRNIMPMSFDSENQLAKMPTIPGEMIELNTESKTARIFDPMAAESEKNRRRQVNAALESMRRSPEGPRPQKIIPLRNNLDWNTWVWHCRQLINDKLAVLVPGSDELPHVKGKLNCNMNDWTQPAVKQRSVDTETEEMEAEINAEEREMIESAAAEA